MRAILTGGGTGGHIYPAISIARGILEKYKDAEILFVGTEKGMENSIVPKEGFPLRTIKVRGFLRKLTFQNVVAIKENMVSFLECRKIIKEFKPDIVIGTGGYVSGTMVMTAALMGIPTMIHEQNAFPGVTNRILSRYVDKIALTFPEASRYFRYKDKIMVTGNPLRGEITKITKLEGMRALGFDENKPLLLIVGGSRGAKKINESSMLVAEECEKKREFQLLHMTGESQYKDVIEQYEKKNIPHDTSYLKVIPYIHNAPYAYAAADLLISRCGAGLISEITALGKPSILIPYPYATDNHQEYNARALEKSNAAIVILESELNEKVLLDKVKYLLANKEKMREMTNNSKKMGKPEATSAIVKIIEGLL
ncbi:undecaprenyldiphospho-muramoylpentapeptide beta-N-acetylglucosaminyltransferase [Lutispora thermophila]|uniref:UDP-N-acetylglucosamine--N-acetylmuramyl-(pentapeptide) pyrophosphoryl-undecaprenol N-acetylglucosamine transferase n=1 Tax=Lutispora thermophila DSM 19022 TaxID=1122184 RepID=A0A1M6CN75_9FIRM|nr:undecaprenyldiphospho-muramoylpentapeptide beta-N-acetylglucosaminyltransferase [Lutispora thermophila]SHI62373.1 UDP-N-acetylglucosamine-N-acetylmuramylpentapeptide N-acetylglucosamine transferase [Lutispora thermophila DSM 19022]